MNKNEFALAVTAKLKEEGFGKVVTSPRHVFHISDDEGNKKDFIVRKTDKTVSLNSKDVNAVLDAACDVLLDILRNGDALSISGIGSLGLKYRKPRKINDRFNSGDWIETSGKYVPNFTSGKDLKIAAKLYELSLIDDEITEDPPLEDTSIGGGV